MQAMMGRIWRVQPLLTGIKRASCSNLCKLFIGQNSPAQSLHSSCTYLQTTRLSSFQANQRSSYLQHIAKRCLQSARREAVEDEPEDKTDLNVAQDISADPNTDLEEVPLSKKVKAKLRECGIESLFPVQVKTFQTLMEGKDVVVRSRTGSGKTIAFALPVIEKILAKRSRKYGRLPMCLVIAPTRELAIQIQREFERIQPDVASTCVYGGVSIGMQVGAIRKGVDVVVGTPGRLIDHLVNATLDVSAVETFILDEADEMLKMGFQDDVEKIIEYLPPSKQTNLWSATMPAWVKDLAQKYCRDVVFFDMVGSDTTRTSITIEHIAIACGYDNHANSILRVVKKYGKGGRVLVFCRTKMEVDRLANFPSLKPMARVIHGDISQAQRERTLQDFRAGRFEVLVATDVAARGIDVPEVELVIQTSVPEDSNTFVHRSGRTGRAGRQGVSVVFYSSGEERDLAEIETELGIQFHLPGCPRSISLQDDELKNVIDSIQSVPESIVQKFLPLSVIAAEKLEEGDAAENRVVAAALALLSGFQGGDHGAISLLTGRPGMITIQVNMDRKTSSQFRGIRGLKDFLRAAFPEIQWMVGKVARVKDAYFLDMSEEEILKIIGANETPQGEVPDVNTDELAGRTFKSPEFPHVQFQIPESLPPLSDIAQAFDMDAERRASFSDRGRPERRPTQGGGRPREFLPRRDSERFPRERSNRDREGGYSRYR